MTDDLVAIARIAKPRGIKGEVVAEILTDFPERFEGLVAVFAVAKDGSRRELKIEDHWFQRDRIVLKFEGLDSVESADTLRDTEICVAESDAVEIADDEFFDWQLIGCVVETTEGTSLGEVSEVMRPGGTELLVVRGGAKEYLIPFAEKICVEVDVATKRVVIDPPEGLLDF